MRPKERLLRRNGNSDQAGLHKLLEEWSDRLGNWEEFWTAVVVFGLVVEYLPLILGIVKAVEKHARLLEQAGGLLVIVGVAGELLVSRRAASVETDLRDISNAMLASALERAAKAEQAAAEANLARVQLEQRMSPRNIDDSERRELIQLLSASAGQTVDIVVFDHHIQETKLFASLGILSLFLAAKWRCRLWESRAVTYRIPGASLLIVTGQGHVDEFKDLAAKMAGLLNKSGIDCDVSHGKFGCTGEFERGEFHLECEEPRQFMGHRIVSPFRIQIGAKQVVPPVSIRTFTLQPAPIKEAR